MLDKSPDNFCHIAIVLTRSTPLDSTSAILEALVHNDGARVRIEYKERNKTNTYLRYDDKAASGMGHSFLCLTTRRYRCSVVEVMAVRSFRPRDAGRIFEEVI